MWTAGADERLSVLVAAPNIVFLDLQKCQRMQFL